MQTKIVWSEVIANDDSETHHWNWARVFSHFNRKALKMVNNQGDPLVYTVGIKQRSAHDGASTGNIPIRSSLSTASNGYVTARAIKSWYKAWRAYLKRNGIKMSDLGKYGKDFRFALTTSDSYESGFLSGEWTNTKLAIEAPQDSANTDSLGANDLIDDFSLTLTGASVAESAAHGEQKYSTVGIIDSWLDSRRNTQGAALDGSDEPTMPGGHEGNPLRNVRSGSTAIEEVLEIVEDAQKEEPPYSPLGHDGLFTQAILSSSVHSSDYTIVQCPAGLMQANIESTLDDNQSVKMEWEVELLDVSPMVA